MGMEEKSQIKVLKILIFIKTLQQSDLLNGRKVICFLKRRKLELANSVQYIFAHVNDSHIVPGGLLQYSLGGGVPLGS